MNRKYMILAGLLSVAALTGCENTLNASGDAAVGVVHGTGSVVKGVGDGTGNVVQGVGEGASHVGSGVSSDIDSDKSKVDND